MRVVIIDDNQRVRAALKLTMEFVEGAEVVGEGKNGGDALALCLEKKPDLIIMDYLMPGMDGLEATRLIRKQNADIKILLLSGSVDPHLEEKSREAGATQFLSKATGVDDLVRVIRSFFP